MFIDIVQRLHRWISLALTPLFIAILLSGALLALEPIFGIGAMQPAMPVNTAALTETLARLEGVGIARALAFEPDGKTLRTAVRTRNASRTG